MTDAPVRSRVHVERAGIGRPLVMLHGWALHGGLFAPLVPDLARRRRVHVVDLPGHGLSDPVHPYKLDTVVDSLDAAFAGETEPLDVLGWSLGGVVAMAWALARPRRIRRLALVCTTPKFVAGPDWPWAMDETTLRRFGDELRVSWRLTLQRFLTLQVHGSMEGKRVLSEMRHALLAHGEPSPVVLGEALDALAHADLRTRVHAIAAPALVVVGERDALTPPGAGGWLASALPDARLSSYAGAAHAPFLSHRDRFVAELGTFLDG